MSPPPHRHVRSCVFALKATLAGVRSLAWDVPVLVLVSTGLGGGAGGTPEVMNVAPIPTVGGASGGDERGPPHAPRQPRCPILQLLSRCGY